MLIGSVLVLALSFAFVTIYRIHNFKHKKRPNFLSCEAKKVSSVFCGFEKPNLILNLIRLAFQFYNDPVSFCKSFFRKGPNALKNTSLSAMRSILFKNLIHPSFASCSLRSLSRADFVSFKINSPARSITGVVLVPSLCYHTI